VRPAALSVCVDRNLTRAAYANVRPPALCFSLEKKLSRAARAMTAA